MKIHLMLEFEDNDRDIPEDDVPNQLRDLLREIANENIIREVQQTTEMIAVETGADDCRIIAIIK